MESEQAARCSPFPERCAEGDADRCEHELVASCMQCVESSDYLGRPAQGVARSNGQPGIWRAVGPLCETSCACDEEQMCRCQEWSEDFEAL